MHSIVTKDRLANCSMEPDSVKSHGAGNLLTAFRGGSLTSISLLAKVCLTPVNPQVSFRLGNITNCQKTSLLIDDYSKIYIGLNVPKNTIPDNLSIRPAVYKC